MKKIKTILILLLVFRFGFSQAVKNPKAEIANGKLKASLYLPDAENGYYQGTRFDWSGVISNLEFNGHTYFGEWFDADNPPLNATITGPVEAYSPLDYATAATGDTFIKLGIGELLKPEEEKYSDFKAYTIVDGGKWTVEQKPQEVHFMQHLENENFSFEYSKTIQLVDNEPKMRIIHRLKNTGKQRIKSVGFNHNFFVLDNKPIGEGFQLVFPTKVSGTGRGLGDVFEFQENKIVFKRKLKADESFACKHVMGINDNVEMFKIRLENLNTGAGVKITGDRPISRLRLWGNEKTVCPETYIKLNVAPNEDFTWTYTYEFYDLDALKE